MKYQFNVAKRIKVYYPGDTTEIVAETMEFTIPKEDLSGGAIIAEAYGNTSAWLTRVTGWSIIGDASQPAE